MYQRSWWSDSDSEAKEVGALEHVGAVGSSIDQAAVSNTESEVACTPDEALVLAEGREAEPVQPLFDLRAMGSIVKPGAKRRRGRPSALQLCLDKERGNAISQEEAMPMPSASASSVIASDMPSGATCSDTSILMKKVVVQPGPLIPVVSNGIGMPTQLGAAVHEAVVLGTSVTKEVALREIASDHFGLDFHNMSLAVMEKRYNLEPKAIQQRLDRLAAAVYIVQGMHRSILEAAVVQQCAKSHLLFYLEQTAYDETPLNTIVKSSGGACVPLDFAGQPSPELQWLRNLRSSSNSSQVAKIYGPTHWPWLESITILYKL
eukprot:4380428-Amphidinium_carterae.1